MMKLEDWPIEKLKHYDKNPRKNEHAVEPLAAAIKEFGFRVPILATSDGSILDGHLRHKAARRLGMETVPVLLADDMTPQQVKAFRLAVNRMAELADWDMDLLSEELRALSADGFNLDILGFAAGDVADWLNPGGGAAGDPDADAPPPPEHPISRLGDLWHLGAHRLICGDSIDRPTVARLLANERPTLMVTDPPYGVEYDADWRNQRLRSNGAPIGGRAVGKVMNDDRADWSAAWALFPGDVAYVWHAGMMGHTVADSLTKMDFIIRAQIIWAKSHHVISRGHYHPKHEPYFYAVRKGGKGHWAGDRKQTTLWSIDKPQKSETGHSTQKPVECMRRPIINNSKPGDAVYEPFSGSGTTIIAAEMEGAGALPWSCRPPTSMWLCGAGRPSVARPRTLKVGKPSTR